MRKIKIIDSILRTLLSREREPIEQISLSICQFVNHIPWYIRFPIILYLFLFEWLYPFFTGELHFFSRAKNKIKQNKYFLQWKWFAITPMGLPFKLCLSLCLLETVGSSQMINEIGYHQDLLRKKHHDHPCTSN